MLFELLSIFDWITPAIAIAHDVKQLPDDLRHVWRGEVLSEHTLFIGNEDYGPAKTLLADMGVPQISVDVPFPLAQEWAVKIPSSELARITIEFYRAGIVGYRA